MNKLAARRDSMDDSEQDDFDLDPEPEEDEVDPYGELLPGGFREPGDDRQEFCQICGREMSASVDGSSEADICEVCQGIPASS
jgi:hypothetical protein